MSADDGWVRSRPRCLTVSASVVLGLLACVPFVSVFSSGVNFALLPVTLVFGYVLARSVFWRSKAATNVVTSGYLLLAFAAFFAVVSGVAESPTEVDASVRPLLKFAAVFLLAGLVSTVLGVQSLRWGRRLAYGVPLVPGRPWMGRLLIVSSLCLCFGGCMYSAYRGFTDVETGEHAASVPWLPEEAGDICYYRSYGFTAYEFDISEQGFLDWSRGGLFPYDVKPIHDPVTMTRYGFVTQLDARPDAALGDATTDEQMESRRSAYDAWQGTLHAVITRGYYYGRQAPNGGGVYVAYDAERGRAYYQSSPR